MMVGALSRKPSPFLVAGANPRSRRSGECTSAASSQGALVSQDTLKTTREEQKSNRAFGNILLICSQNGKNMSL
jgi:hypothetical protein